MASKKALITGITGQDGSYLAEFLLDKGYEVHGMVRRSSSFNRDHIEHLIKKDGTASSCITLHYGDLTDHQNIDNLVATIRPQEIYVLLGRGDNAHSSQ